MSKYAIDRETLQGIADAIRVKTRKSNTITGSEMASAITSIESISQEALQVTGKCTRRFINNYYNWFIRDCGLGIITTDVTDCSYMFESSTDLMEIPFDINCKEGVAISLQEMFSSCFHLRSIPKITKCKPSSLAGIFDDCNRLVEIPSDIANWFDWSYIETEATGSRSGQFFNCCSLKQIPVSFLEHSNPNSKPTSTYLNKGFYNCKALGALVDLPIPFGKSTSSYFDTSTFGKCGRLRNLTFALDPNTNAPYVKEWSSQVISLETIGVTAAASDFYESQNTSGITSAHRVVDDESYQRFKVNSLWWTTDHAYSRYNRTSAVATINSLPDTSAFIAAGNTVNTIKFKGEAGSRTDGGAINTMTAQEIAVATAKGWTVSFV